MIQKLQTVLTPYLDLMTTAPTLELTHHFFKTTLIFQFLFRLHCLLPKDGWGTWKYDDFKVQVPQLILSTIFNQDSLILKVILIIMNGGCLLMSFAGIKLMYYYNNIAWHLFFMPQVSILFDFQTPVISFIALFLLLIQSFLNLYFNRGTKFMHNNPFIRKFTNLTLISLFINTLTYMNFSYFLIRIVLLHFSTIVEIIDIYIFHPYKPPLNEFVFKCSITQYSLIVMTTIYMIAETESNLFYSFFFFGTMSLALATIIIERSMKKSVYDQYYILVQCQQMYISENIEKQILLSTHKQKCKFKHDMNLIDCIICILDNAINKNKAQKLGYEILELGLINFLSQHKAALTAFCRLKLYYNAVEDHTFYFQISFPVIDKKLWKKVRDVQDKVTRQIRSTSYYDERDLKTKDIYEASLMKDQFYPKIINVLNCKLDYWNQLLSDLTNYQRLFDHTIKFSGQIFDFIVFMKNLFGQNLDEIEEVKTVIEFKMLEIYFCVIVNDQVMATKMQKYVIEKLRQETQQDGKLLNCSIMENKVVLLYTSIVKAQGYIIKTNSEQLAKFWGYDGDLDFIDIKHINQLMPNFCASVHDQYIERFQMLGHSILFGKCRTIFLIDKYGLLIPASITIDNFFITYDDYVITAAFAKNKETSLYILFDSKGKILGITQLMFRVFHSIDPSITPEILNQGYIFQIIPKIFYLANNHINCEYDNLLFEEKIYLQLGNPIKQQFNKPININKQNRYYDDLWTLYDDSQNHPTEMFSVEYQDSVSKFIDTSIKTTNFEIICQLHYQLIGYYKIMPMFTLEILDIIRADFQSTQSFSSDQFGDLLSPDPVDFSSIQEESFQQIKKDLYPETKLDHQLHSGPEVSLIKGKYDFNLLHQIDQQDSSKQTKQTMAPQSQRAKFQLIKQKTLNDDLKVIEEDIKLIKLTKRKSQKALLICENDKEDKKSSVKLTKRQHIIDQIQEKRREDINEMDAVNSVNSIASNLINYKRDLVKSVYQSDKALYSLKMIILFDILIFASIIIFNAYPIILFNDDNDHAVSQIDAIVAPYLYNQYYCQLYVNNLIFELQKLNITNYSDELITDIENLNKNSQLLEDLNFYYPALLELEKLDYFPELKVIYLNQQDEYNVSFTYLYNLMIEKLQYFMKKGQDYKSYQMNESEIISSLYLYANLQNTISLYSDLITLIVDTFFEDLSNDQEVFLNVLLIGIAVVFVLFWVQVIYYHQIFNYYKKIIYLNCRLLEKDVHLIVQRLQLIKEILIEHTQTNWKKADYVHLMFQQIKPDQLQIQSKISKHTLLCSRIAPSRFSLFTILMLIITLQIFLIVLQIGGYYFVTLQGQELTPQYRLMSEFFQFSITFDSMVAQSVRVKGQRLYMLNNNINGSITVEKNVVNAKLAVLRAISLSYYSDLYDVFTNSEIKIINGLIGDNDVDSSTNSSLYYIFFDNICSLVCSTSTDARDNNEFLVHEGLSGIYSSMSKYIKSSYDYELENSKQNPDIAAQKVIVNSHEFIILFARHFINTKKAFLSFQKEILNRTYDVLNSNDAHIKVYHATVLVIEVLTVSIILFIYVQKKHKQIQLMRLSLTSIPIDLLDQQSISILKTL